MNVPFLSSNLSFTRLPADQPIGQETAANPLLSVGQGRTISIHPIPFLAYVLFRCLVETAFECHIKGTFRHKATFRIERAIFDFLCQIGPFAKQFLCVLYAEVIYQAAEVSARTFSDGRRQVLGIRPHYSHLACRKGKCLTGLSRSRHVFVFQNQ